MLILQEIEMITIQIPWLQGKNYSLSNNELFRLFNGSNDLNFNIDIAKQWVERIKQLTLFATAKPTDKVEFTYDSSEKDYVMELQFKMNKFTIRKMNNVWMIKYRKKGAPKIEEFKTFENLSAFFIALFVGSGK